MRSEGAPAGCARAVSPGGCGPICKHAGARSGCRLASGRVQRRGSRRVDQHPPGSPPRAESAVVAGVAGTDASLPMRRGRVIRVGVASLPP